MLKAIMLQSRRSQSFYFRLVVKADESVAVSETYPTKGECREAVQQSLAALDNDQNVQRRKAKDGRQFFEVSSDKGAVLVRSQLHVSDSGVENALRSLRKASSSGVSILDQAYEQVRSPNPDDWLKLSENEIPPAVLRDYAQALERVARFIDVRSDTIDGEQMDRFVVDVKRFADRAGPHDDEGFDCLGTVGTYGCYGGCVGTFGTFGCSDPDDIEFCWNCGACSG